MGWGGVGWGMLTFVWTCWGSWCYADDGDDGRPAKKSCQRVCMPGVRTWFFIARCGNGDSSTRTKTWRKPRCPNCKRCKNDGADSWACLNLFEAEIAFRLGEIHIYLKKPPNSDVWISEFLWSLNCVFAWAKRWFFEKKQYFTTSLSGPPGSLCVYLFYSCFDNST